MPAQVNTAALEIVVEEAKTLLALKKFSALHLCQRCRRIVCDRPPEDTEEKLSEFETSIIMLENSLKKDSW